MSESECDYEEEARDEVMEPIRFYSTQNIRHKSMQLNKTPQVNFTTLRNQKNKQCTKLIINQNNQQNNLINCQKIRLTTIKSQQANQNPLKMLIISLSIKYQQNQQKTFLVFLLISTEQLSLSLSQKCDASCQICDLIFKLIPRFNEYLEIYQLINNYKLYQIVDATEKGEKHSLSYPYEYTAKVCEIETQCIRLEPRTKIFLFYPQMQEDKIQKKFNLLMSNPVQDATYSKVLYRNSSAISYYSQGLNKCNDEQQTRTQSNDFFDAENNQLSLIKQLQQSKAKPIEKTIKDQQTHEISSCNLFSFLNFFKTKKKQAKQIN